MRKFGILFCILAVGLTACQGAGNDGQPTTAQKPSTTQSDSLNPDSLADQVDSYVGAGGTTPATDSPNQEDDGSQIPDSSELQEPDDKKTAEGNGADNQSAVSDGTGSFDVKDDTVYATTNVVVRNQPSTKGEPVMNLKKGESVHRVGYGADWTKVEIKGYFYYIATQYLSETP